MTQSSMSQRDAYRVVFKDYPDVLDVGQMCAMLGGISIKTGYKILRENQIEHIKVGRAYRIPKANILDYLRIGRQM